MNTDEGFEAETGGALNLHKILEERNNPMISEELIRSSAIALDLFQKYKKKPSRLEKTCLEAFYGSKNMLSVEECLEILCDNNRLPTQLLLSSEIGELEDQPSQNIGNP